MIRKWNSACDPTTKHIYWLSSLHFSDGKTEGRYLTMIYMPNVRSVIDSRVLANCRQKKKKKILQQNSRKQSTQSFSYFLRLREKQTRVRRIYRVWGSSTPTWPKYSSFYVKNIYEKKRYLNLIKTFNLIRLQI